MAKLQSPRTTRRTASAVKPQPSGQTPSQTSFWASITDMTIEEPEFDRIDHLHGVRRAARHRKIV